MLNLIPLSAADSTPRLPKEGTWTKYQVIIRRDNGTEVNFTEKISLLGGEQWNGEACRWVEIEEMYEGQDKPQIHKLLVPEKDLLRSDQPLASVKQWISKYEDKVTVQADDYLDRAGAFGASFVFLPGLLKETKPVDEPKQVEYQAGRLSVEKGRKGTYVWSRKFQTVEGSVKFTWEYIQWLHPDVPFGFAHARMKLTVKSTIQDAARVSDYEFLLKETGTGAKSAIMSGT